MSRVRRYVLVATVGALAIPVAPASAQLNPGDVVVADRDADPQGIGGNTGAILRVDPASGAVSVLATSSMFVDPRGVAVDGAGAVLVADASADPNLLGGNPGAIFRIAPGQAPAVLATSPQFVDPWGIAVDGSGNVVVSDSNANPAGSIFA